jgi:hypothetical protein
VRKWRSARTTGDRAVARLALRVADFRVPPPRAPPACCCARARFTPWVCPTAVVSATTRASATYANLRIHRSRPDSCERAGRLWRRCDRADLRRNRLLDRRLAARCAPHDGNASCSATMPPLCRQPHAVQVGWRYEVPPGQRDRGLDRQACATHQVPHHAGRRSGTARQEACGQVGSPSGAACNRSKGGSGAGALRRVSCGSLHCLAVTVDGDVYRLAAALSLVVALVATALVAHAQLGIRAERTSGSWRHPEPARCVADDGASSH